MRHVPVPGVGAGAVRLLTAAWFRLNTGFIIIFYHGELTSSNRSMWACIHTRMVEMLLMLGVGKQIRLCAVCGVGGT